MNALLLPDFTHINR